ncbi:hypothetical protein QTH90_30135 [Variovorax sp. J2P1-59]|uniref:hypothetical protein n=1 Tax=Variovorax flavidus TaxID=3053501 RepID=UPI0025763ED2|nr:hypothetical protein [Variovorax sp. J2P1-59]MDM0078701.1 hypothetical protein [Variovorax sp. J2P1-59]
MGLLQRMNPFGQRSGKLQTQPALGAAANLLEAIEGMAAMRGIVLPPCDPYPDQQVVYERYLKSVGLDHSQVDRILNMGRIPEEKRAAAHGMLLAAVLNSGSISNGELAAILTVARTIFSEQRATSLLRTISAPIYEKARKVPGRLSGPLAMGVFPFRWFNGQSSAFEGTSMCLAATGSFDLIEIFSTLFAARQKDPGYAVEKMREALATYVRTNEVESPKYGLGEGLVDFGNAGGIHTLLTTAGEQFLISHEFGHVALGHTVSSPRGAMPTRAVGLLSQTPNDVQVIRPEQLDEYCADVWALQAMLALAEEPEYEEKIPIFCGGAAVFLGLAVLVEAASRAARIDTKDSHPPASNRLYLIELAFELFGHHENAFVARRVREFVDEVGAEYPGFEMPPMLSRPLNQIAAQVFEKLNLDLSHAPYITDFR